MPRMQGLIYIGVMVVMSCAFQYQAKLLADGFRVRVYIPFGRDWYAYSVRRLRENPRLAGYVFKAMLK